MFSLSFLIFIFCFYHRQKSKFSEHLSLLLLSHLLLFLFVIPIFSIYELCFTRTFQKVTLESYERIKWNNKGLNYMKTYVPTAQRFFFAKNWNDHVGLILEGFFKARVFMVMVWWTLKWVMTFLPSNMVKSS